MHYERKRRTGSVGSAEKRSGKDGWVTPKGYRMFKVDGRHISAQRLAMQEHLGRDLRPEETVHHRNGDRLDNRIENLELWSSSHPAGQRVSDKVDWAKELLALYEPEALREGAAG
jgi:hypothetical protein